MSFTAKVKRSLPLLRQGIQGEVQFHDSHLSMTRVGLHLDCRVQGNAVGGAATVGGYPCPGVVDQNPAHGLRNQREEVSPVGKLDFGTADQLQIDFVHQRSRPQRMARALLAQVPPGNAMQIGIHGVHQFAARRFVSGAELLQQLGDLGFPFADAISILSRASC